MRTLSLWFFLLTFVGLSGCVDRTSAGRTDYDSLPGSGDHMASAPGLLSKQMGSTGTDGLTLYSTGGGSSADDKQLGGIKKTFSKQNSNGKEYARDHDYSNFVKFKEYREFLALPKSDERKKAYRRWLEWRNSVDGKSEP